MANQEQSRDGIPRKDKDEPSGQDYQGDGPGKIGVTSDNQPDLVAPAGVTLPRGCAMSPSSKFSAPPPMGLSSAEPWSRSLTPEGATRSGWLSLVTPILPGPSPW